MLQVIGYWRGTNTFVIFVPFLYVCVFYSNHKSNIQEGIQLRFITPTPEEILTKGFKAMSTATSTKTSNNSKLGEGAWQDTEMRGRE